MLIAEYVQNGYLIRVYSENGKRTVSLEVYNPKGGKPPLPLFLIKKRTEKQKEETNE